MIPFGQKLFHIFFWGDGVNFVGFVIASIRIISYPKFGGVNLTGWPL